MFYAVLTLHILAAVFLVLIVLLQSGRGAELGAAFGGMGQATFGRGQSTFISKLTTGVAVVFMCTSLTLAFLTTERPQQSVLPSGSPAPAAATPAPGTTTPPPATTAPAPAAATPASQAPAPQQPAEQADAPAQGGPSR